MLFCGFIFNGFFAVWKHTYYIFEAKRDFVIQAKRREDGLPIRYFVIYFQKRNSHFHSREGKLSMSVVLLGVHRDR